MEKTVKRNTVVCHPSRQTLSLRKGKGAVERRGPICNTAKRLETASASRADPLTRMKDPSLHNELENLPQVCFFPSFHINSYQCED